LAALRNAAVRLSRTGGIQPVVAATEYSAEHRDAATDDVFKGIK
jgi:hypothetical protein